MRTGMLRSVAGFLVLGLVFSGCGDKSSSPGPGADTPAGGVAPISAKGAKPWDPAAGTATVKGLVKFSGEKPTARPIDMAGADKKCAEVQQGKQVLPQTVLVNDNGTLRNVFVWVKKGLEGWEFPAVQGDALIDQKGCMYAPHVQGMRAGQTLRVKNSDPTTHNINCQAVVNRKFNRAQPERAADLVEKFDKQEVPVKFKCDIHPWMNAWALVVPHPYFVVTGTDGGFSLPNLPPGDYTIEAWHEKYGKQEQRVKVGDKESKQIEFTFKEG